VLPTETLQPATPSDAPVAPSPAPSPITTPDAFLQALIATNFDFPSLARAIPAPTLLTLIKTPDLLASLDDLARFSATCAALRDADLRQLALSHLAAIVADPSADPVETRRAASSILRASNQPREPRAPRIAGTSLTPPHPPREPNPPHSTSSPGGPRVPVELSRSGIPLNSPDGYPYRAPKPGPSLTNPSTLPAASTHTPSTPAPVPSPSVTNNPNPDHQSPPSPYENAEQVIGNLLSSFARPGNNNCGLRFVETFLDSSATINGAPLSVSDRTDTFRQLANLPLADVQGEPRGTVLQWPHEPSHATTVHAIVEFPPSVPSPQRLKLTLTLTRSPASRWPNCWLIHSAQTQSLPDTS